MLQGIKRYAAKVNAQATWIEENKFVLFSGDFAGIPYGVVTDPTAALGTAIYAVAMKASPESEPYLMLSEAVLASPYAVEIINHELGHIAAGHLTKMPKRYHGKLGAAKMAYIRRWNVDPVLFGFEVEADQYAVERSSASRVIKTLEWLASNAPTYTHREIRARIEAVKEVKDV